MSGENLVSTLLRSEKDNDEGEITILVTVNGYKTGRQLWNIAILEEAG